MIAFQTVVSKLRKLNRQHFKTFARNELLLNTISYLPNVELEIAVPMLGAKLTAEVADGNTKSFLMQSRLSTIATLCHTVS